MNRAYFLVPCGLLIGFGIFQQRDRVARQKRDAIHAVGLAAARAAEDEKKAALKREADRRAKQAADERAAQERERREKKHRDFEAAMQKLAGDTAAHTTEADRLARDVEAAERRIAERRAEKETSERAALGLAKEVERGRIERRNADLEIQRAVKMVAACLEASPLANGEAPGVPRGR